MSSNHFLTLYNNVIVVLLFLSNQDNFDRSNDIFTLKLNTPAVISDYSITKPLVKILLCLFCFRSRVTCVKLYRLTQVLFCIHKEFENTKFRDRKKINANLYVNESISKLITLFKLPEFRINWNYMYKLSRRVKFISVEKNKINTILYERFWSGMELQKLKHKVKTNK